MQETESAAQATQLECIVASEASTDARERLPDSRAVRFHVHIKKHRGHPRRGLHLQPTCDIVIG